MESIYLNERVEKDEFAKRAAAFFAKNEKCTTYTDEDIKKGCFFALRFGLRDDCSRLRISLQPIAPRMTRLALPLPLKVVVVI